MIEPEDNFDLNCLLSGELSTEAAAVIRDRLQREPELQAAYEQLRLADQLAREAYFEDELPAEGPLVGQPSPAGATQSADESRREEQINRIVKTIVRRAEDESGRNGHRREEGRRGREGRRGQHGGRGLWRKARWVLATAATVLIGLALVNLFWPLGLQRRTFRPVAGLAAEDVSRLKLLHDKLDQGGQAAVIVWHGDSASFDVVQKGSAQPAVVRVTVRRTLGDEVQEWTADAVVPSGQIAELVTDAEAKQWPASIRLSVKPSEGGVVPVTVDAQLLRGGCNVKSRVLLETSETKSVATVEYEGARYELFLQAEVAKPSEIM